MAKFKPHRVPVLLKGGPCDGTKTTAVRGEDLLHPVVCKGVTYEPSAEVTKDNRVVYVTRASQQHPTGPHVPPGTKPSRAHESWHRMLRTVFVDSPKELRRAADARVAIRRLRHRHGLR